LAIGFQQAKREGTYQVPISLQQLAHDGDFEKAGTSKSEPAAGWTRDLSRTRGKGSVSVDALHFHSGGSSLRMQPTRKNRGAFPLAISQVIPGGSWRGKDVEVSGYVLVRGSLVANIGMLNFIGKRGSDLVSAKQSDSAENWVQISEVYHVPDDPAVQLILTCYVEGSSGEAWFDDVAVFPSTGGPDITSSRELGKAPPPSVSESRETLGASISVDATHVIREIPRTLYGTNVEWIWNGNLLWDDKTNQPNSELVRLTKEMGVSLIRYPGGHFSDFYHWKDAIGPPGKRREVQHEPGKGDKSVPFFGTDEALRFARLVNGELLITVNAGTGTAQEAADWVRYVNGKGTQVRYWEIGNELYTKDSSPISKATTTDPRTYASRVRQFAAAMRAADPSIKIGAIGGENQGLYKTVSYPDWDRTVLQNAGDQIDFLAIHDAYAPIVMGPDEKKDVRTVYRSMLAAPLLIAHNLDVVSKQIEEFAPAHASKIKIAVTEWGPVFQFDARSRYVDHVKTMGSALFAASTLKAFLESTRTDIANFFLLNDLSVLGWIGSTNGDFPPHPKWAPTPRYLTFQLFTSHFGERLIATNVQSPSFSSQTVGFTVGVSQAPTLESVASLSGDGKRLFIIGLNKDFDHAVNGKISIKGFLPQAAADAWAVTSTSIDANTGTTVLRVPGLRWAKQAEDSVNPRFNLGSPSEVVLSRVSVTDASSEFTWTFPPHSVTSLVLTKAAPVR
jgi:alpha-N-arabinofuranosidase